MTNGCRIEIHETKRRSPLPLMMQLDYWNGLGFGGHNMRTHRTNKRRRPVWAVVAVVAVVAYFAFFATLITAFGVTLISSR